MNSATSSSPPSARPDRPLLLIRLGLALGLALSWLVRPRGPREPLRLGRRELPSLCLVRRLSGHRCPGCGMSRGFVYMFRLRPRAAGEANPAAPLAFLALLALALGGRGAR